jgi:hypothetical protein
LSTRSAKSSSAAPESSRTIAGLKIAAVGLDTRTHTPLGNQRLIGSARGDSGRSLRSGRHIDGRSLSFIARLTRLAASPATWSAPKLGAIPQGQRKIDFRRSRADSDFFARGSKSEHFDAHGPDAWSHAVDLKRTIIIGQSAQGFVTQNRFDRGAGNGLVCSRDNSRLPECNRLHETSRETHSGHREIFHVKNDEPPKAGVFEV